MKSDELLATGFVVVVAPGGSVLFLHTGVTHPEVPSLLKSDPALGRSLAELVSGAHLVDPPAPAGDPALVKLDQARAALVVSADSLGPLDATHTVSRGNGDECKVYLSRAAVESFNSALAAWRELTRDDAPACARCGKPPNGERAGEFLCAACFELALRADELADQAEEPTLLAGMPPVVDDTPAGVSDALRGATFTPPACKCGHQRRDHRGGVCSAESCGCLVFVPRRAS